MNSWLTSIQWLVFLALCRMSYQAANIMIPTASPQLENKLIQKDSPNETITPQEKEWADKANRRYTAAQEKKWHSWNEAMFER